MGGKKEAGLLRRREGENELAICELPAKSDRSTTGNAMLGLEKVFFLSRRGSRCLGDTPSARRSERSEVGRERVVLHRELLSLSFPPSLVPISLLCLSSQQLSLAPTRGHIFSFSQAPLNLTKLTSSSGPTLPPFTESLRLPLGRDRKSVV